MRAISLVNRIEFQFMGNIARNALTLGDVDNDGCNELVIGNNVVVGNNVGEVAIFKGKEKVQSITGLNFVTCVAVGDILNRQKNSLVIITADGWCYIYDSLGQDLKNYEMHRNEEESNQSDYQTQSTETLEYSTESNRSQSNKSERSELVCVHIQRIPANAKNIVLGDIDNDGMIEMILGLTDRVVRSYRWLNIPNKSPTELKISRSDSNDDQDMHHFGKLVALNKWECANQIGSITLHHSNGKPTLLIAQPGGTFMRIRCQPEDSLEDNNIELGESSSAPNEALTGSSVDYQFLGISRMRNQNISTEILGDFKNADLAKCPYAVATLDGTIMLVQDETILWSIAVDHQIFALTKLDVTGSGTEDIVVCAWDGQTYILDQEKNSVRFHLDEPVQAFHSGYYSISLNEPPVTCLVYVTFKNSIILYYDIPLKELVGRKFEPDLVTLSKLFVRDGRTEEEALEMVKNMNRKTRNQLVQYLLYNVKK